MVHPLYSVCTLTYAIVLGIILVNAVLTTKEPDRLEHAYRTLVAWVLFFCLQDTVWGLCGSPLIQSDGALIAASTVFHLSTVCTTFFWLNYVLTFLGDQVKHAKVYLALNGLIIAVQVALLAVNLSNPIIFYVGPEGTYCTGPLRPFAFANQYVVYLAMGVLAAASALRSTGSARRKMTSVFFFALAPILNGILQMLYPDGPFYSVGYFLGCIIVHIFVVTDARFELQRKQERAEAAASMERQIAISNTDQLTSLFNRRAYEDDVRKADGLFGRNDFAYLSVDVNGLKKVNDTLGHAAGDELLQGAAECLKGCLGGMGRVYRIGGDEFAALIRADEPVIQRVIEDLKRTADAWTGANVKSLTMAVGAVLRSEFPSASMLELAKVADKRMYAAKATYYARAGIDRRGAQQAYSPLIMTFEKVLKVNLTTDSFKIIRMDESEMTPERGYSPKLSAWLHNFGVGGHVHPDDLSDYLIKTNLDSLRAHFASGGAAVSVFYKRRVDDAFFQAMMELVPAEDFSPFNQSLYLYVKDISAPL